ncbi:hypothetical protein [uncultured Oscillibacter sp.]|nr:hypothetical protein [uncultured Oscillibacter sp.]
MSAMIDFSAAMLQALAAFLGSEPVIYLFGMVVFCFLCKGIKTLIA